MTRATPQATQQATHPTTPPATRRQDERELGFGTRVGAGRAGRLMNRDGSFNVQRRGMPVRSLVSLSHRLLLMTWPAFLGVLLVACVIFNGAFALVYWALGPGAIEGPTMEGLARCFFFSVQTSSTIGYGQLVPATLAANLVMTVEAVVALISFALVSGITYARFTRVTADFVFSRNALIAPYRDGLSLQMRLGNQRRGQILGLRARVFLSQVSLEEGLPKRTFHELVLERQDISFLPLTWTIVHPIDAESPLLGATPRTLEEADAEIFVVLVGTEETFSQVVHARTSYKPHELVWNARFESVYERTPTGIPTCIDLSRIHEIERLTASGPGAAT